ncbi:MAG: FtsX-like permease family protein [Thermoplasmata archaeon]
MDGRENLTGTLAFSKFVIKDIFRNRSRTFSSIIGVVLAVSLIAGENIAMDTTARDVLSGELADYHIDLYGSTDEVFTTNDLTNLSEELVSVYGVEDVLPMSYVRVELEVHNESTIVPPKYGYYEKYVDVDIPVNGSVWLNVTLEQISHETYRLFGNVYSLHNSEPVENILVEVREGTSWFTGYKDSTYSDEQGYYEFYLPEADYIISMRLKKYLNGYSSLTNLAEYINITSSMQERQLDFYIPDVESSTLQGYIMDPYTGEPYNGTVDLNIWESTQISNHSNMNIYYFYFSANGSYYLDLVPGNFTIGITPEDLSIEQWRMGVGTNYTQVEVKSNTSVWLNLTVGDFYPDENVVLEGYVYDLFSGDPVQYASVSVRSLDKSYRNSTNADEFGYFQMNIVPGNISVDVKKYGEYLTQETQIYNSLDQDRREDFYLKPRTSLLKGYVRTQQGEGLSDAYIELLETDIESDTYHTNGYYELRIGAGNYSIMFDAEPDDFPIKHKKYWTNIYGMIPSPENLQLLKDSFPYELRNGSMDLGDGKVVVSENIADEYHLEVGNEVNLVLRELVWDPVNFTNAIKFNVITFNISGIVVREYYPYMAWPDFLVSQSDFDIFHTLLDNEEFKYFVSTELFIKMDRDKIIDSVSRETTEFALLRLTNKINSLSYIKYDILVQRVIDEPLENYYNWLESYRVELLAYSLPVIAVGLYLGVVGIELATGQKRRALGILKSRGASEKQIFMSLLLEAVILGIIAGVVGLILGVFVSRIFLTIIPGSRSIATQLDFFRLNVSAMSVLMAMLFAVLLMLLASIKPAKRVSKAPVIESIHRYSEIGTEKEYKPTLDIFLVSFAVMAFIVISEINYRSLDPAEMGMIFTMLIFVIYLVSVIWLPFSPFILMFSLTRLLTRGTNKVYRFFSRGVKPFAGELWYVIHKNIMRNPKRVSMMSIIIALAIGFGIFMTTMIATTMYGEELEARAKIGSDIHVVPLGENMSFEEKLESIDGVEEAIAVNWGFGGVLAGEDFVIRKISLFNATEYHQHVEIPDYYFVEGEPNKAFTTLRMGNSVIIGESIAQIYSIDLGSIIRIEYINLADEGLRTLKNNDFIVAGIVRALPGLEIPEDDYYDWGTQIYMDFASLESSLTNVNSGWRFLVEVEKGRDSSDVENTIWEELSPSIMEIKNLDTTIKNIRNDMPSKSVLYIMLVNIGFMIIIITVGLGLIMFISITERKNEFATIMARGAEAKQMAILILGEAFSITMVGVVVGVFAGLFTAYTFNKMLSTNTLFGVSGDILSGRPLIVPWYGVIVIILAVLALIVTAILAAYKVKRIKLHQALRSRGG